MQLSKSLLLLLSLSLTGSLVACDGDDIDSDEEARRAYLGLDTSIEKSITLGFQGFNAASSANIDPQSVTGTVAGNLTVTGQVDQGSSANKGMRLRVGMVDYTDGPFPINDDGDTIEIIYDTDMVVESQPFLSMQLKNIPTGTLDGTLMGTYFMEGAIEGEAVLNLTFSGQLMDGGNGTVVRVPGTTSVTGTVEANGGTFTVDVDI